GEAAYNHVVPYNTSGEAVYSHVVLLQHQREAAYNNVIPLQHQWGGGLQPCGPPTSSVRRRPTTTWSQYNTSGEAAYNLVVLLQHQWGGGLQPCDPPTAPLGRWPITMWYPYNTSGRQPTSMWSPPAIVGNFHNRYGPHVLPGSRGRTAMWSPSSPVVAPNHVVSWHQWGRPTTM
ncbi:hypothetical protein Hamer_G031674, partial [Homarus americanus]